LRLAVLTGLYVGVVVMAQVGANKIVVKYAATVLVGVPLVLVLRRYVRPR
jgi:hypothetical protein